MSDLLAEKSLLRPVLRTDPLFGREVFIVENRADRPQQLVPSVVEEGKPSAEELAECPFCPGNEAHTPPSLFEISSVEGTWQTRVILNKYPAVLPSDGTVGSSSSVFAVGEHEVLIATNRHVTTLGQLTESELQNLVTAIQNRVAHHRQNSKILYTQVFFNVGQKAGATLAHLHGQIVALQHVPKTVAAEHQRATEFAEKNNGNCATCKWIAAERQTADREVLERDGLVVVCPPASMQPYEMWVFPMEHNLSFEQFEPQAIARMLETLTAKLEQLVPGVHYNMMLMGSGTHHWRLEIVPRIAQLAGFELSTGTYLNCVSPERAAVRLRDG